MATLEPLTATARSFRPAITISEEGLELGRSVSGPGYLTLPTSWLQVSSKHCRFYIEKGQWYVRDLSRNGTKVNNIKLNKGSAQQLEGGEEITVSLAANGSEATHVKWRFVKEPNNLTAKSPSKEASQLDAAVQAAPLQKRKIDAAEQSPVVAKRPHTADIGAQSALYQQNAKLRKQIEDQLEAHQAEIKQNRQRALEEKAVLRGQLQVLQAKLDAAEKKASASGMDKEAAAELASKSEELSVAQRQLSTKNGEVERLAGELIVSRAEQAKAKESSNAQREECSKLQSENAALEDKQRTMEEKLSTVLSELKHTKEASSATGGKLKSRVEALDSELARIKQQLGDALEENAHLRNEASGAASKSAAEATVLQNEIYEITQRWKFAQGREQAARNELASKEAVTQDIHAAFSRVKAALSSLGELAAEQDSRLQQLAVAAERGRAVMSEAKEAEQEMERQLEFALEDAATARPNSDADLTLQAGFLDAVRAAENTQMPAAADMLEGTQGELDFPTQAHQNSLLLFAQSPPAKATSTSNTKFSSQHLSTPAAAGSQTLGLKIGAATVEDSPEMKILNLEQADGQESKGDSDKVAGQDSGLPKGGEVEMDVFENSASSQDNVKCKENRPPASNNGDCTPADCTDGLQSKPASGPDMLTTAKIRSQNHDQGTPGDITSSEQEEGDQSMDTKTPLVSPIKNFVKGQTCEDDFDGME